LPPVVKEEQQRPLKSVYAVVFMDGIHFHVRSEAQIVKKSLYIAIGVQMDGLTGFPGAIEAVFPQTEIQQCIIRQIRNTTRFISYKDIKRVEMNGRSGDHSRHARPTPLSCG